MSLTVAANTGINCFDFGQGSIDELDEIFAIV